MTSVGSPVWLPVGLIGGISVAGLTGDIGIPPVVVYGAFSVVIFLVALSLPLLSIGRFVGNGRVWRALLIINLVAVPLLAFVLSRILWRSPDLQLGLLLALLAPGVALSIPIIRRAGGDVESVLGITPLLLLGQLLVVPPLAIVLTGGLFSLTDISHTLVPIALVIVLPVALAAVFQAAERRSGDVLAQPRRRLTAWTGVVAGVAFFVTAWSEASTRLERVMELSWLVPLTIAFLVLMAPIALLVAGLAGVDADKRRAILISAVGRGGMVITPITLALETDFWSMVALAVMTQASVEALGLMVYRSISPEIVPGR
jgi:ACR3 family arsenite transporter